MVKLATQRKHLTDIIKMVAYQAESDLLALLRPHYARVDQEGRTLLHELFATAGDIRVCNNELHITLAPLSSPHRTRAAQALCGMLDQTATIFPGSRLRIRSALRPPARIGLAFPGSPVGVILLRAARSLSSCLEATRMWRRTERASLEKKPSKRLSQDPWLGVNVNSERCAG